jgi:GT2 family glycosyltransferase
LAYTAVPLKPAPAVSVVICAYTCARLRDLLDAVASVEGQSLAALETIVVIDHEPTLLEVAASAFERARVIENSHPRGLAGARNSGVETARGEIVAFLDDDAIAERTWLEELVDAYDDPRVIGTGGAALPRWARGRAPRWLPSEFYWIVGCSYRGLPERRAPVRNPIGASMSFRRSVLQELGGFSEGIGRVGRTPLGCEETELSIRALAARPGGVVLHVPSARVWHRVPDDRARWSYFRARCRAEGLSKALVTRHVGAGDGLASERAYTLRTLPGGLARGLTDAVRGDAAGLARAGAIVAGLAITLAGYVHGLARLARAR